MSPRTELGSKVTDPGLVVALAGILAVCGWLFSQPVPASNEWIYLLGPYRQWHPDFLPGDWTFDYPWWEHLPFNVVAGLPMLVFPIEWVAWTGRAISWLVVAIALLQLGKRLGLHSLVAGLGIICWLLYGQSLYGGEWMLETFEAKPFAYALLLFGLDSLLGKQYRRAGILLGLTFTVHPSVGLSGGAAALAAAFIQRPGADSLRRLAGWGFLLALPGLLLLLPVLVGGAGNARADWEYLAKVRMPPLLDPFSAGRRYPAIGFLMLGAIGLHCFENRDDRVGRFWFWFTSALAAVSAGGMIAFTAGWYEWLRIFPFRLFPTFILLLFMLTMLARLTQKRGLRSHLATAAMLAVCLIPLGARPVYAVSSIQNRGTLWHDDPALHNIWDWLRSSTAPGDLVLAPPWRPDGLYHGQRPQIVSWQGIRYDQLAEWRSRYQELVGVQVNPTIANMESGYSALDQEDIVAMAERHGASYLISWSDYSFPEVFRSGRYRVYSIAEVAPGP